MLEERKRENPHPSQTSLRMGHPAVYLCLALSLFRFPVLRLRVVQRGVDLISGAISRDALLCALSLFGNACLSLAALMIGKVRPATFRGFPRLSPARICHQSLRVAIPLAFHSAMISSIIRAVSS